MKLLHWVRKYEKRDRNVEPHGGSEISDHSRRGASSDAVGSNSQAGNSDQVEKQRDQFDGVTVDAFQSYAGETVGVSDSYNKSASVETRKRRTYTNSMDSRNNDPDARQRKSEISKACESQQLVKDETDGRPKASSATSNQKKQAVLGNVRRSDDRKSNAEHDPESLDLANDETKVTETEFKKRAGGGASSESQFPEINTKESQGSTQVEEDAREMSERQADVAKKPHLWGNLKSFADGILSIWKKW